MATESKEEILERTRQEHAKLHERLSSLIERLGRDELDQQRPHVCAMLRELHASLLHDDSTLLPLLNTTDAWGPTRAARLQRANTILRLEIARLFADLEDDALEGAEALEPILARFDEALAIAERDALTEEALRDDLILIDYGGG